MEDLSAIADIIRERKYVVAFTGAGISVDAGIPAFRGGQGLWEKYDPMEYAEISSFVAKPEKVWVMLREMAEVVFASAPSEAHRALGKLEEMGYLKAVITQNVDGLHQEAGNSNVIEYHGKNRWKKKKKNKTRLPITPGKKKNYTKKKKKKTKKQKKENPRPQNPPPRPANRPPFIRGATDAVRPETGFVFFGEGIHDGNRGPTKRQTNANSVHHSTSGVVYPAATYPIARNRRMRSSWRSMSKGHLSRHPSRSIFSRARPRRSSPRY
jgi:NAD-dependent SIR2 family protein deacetylase